MMEALLRRLILSAKQTQFSSQKANPDYPGVLDISPEELKDLKDQVQLIDVRRPDEFTGELGHIPGSELIVLDTLTESVDRLDKNKTIVFICRSGARSARASMLVKEFGITDTYNMWGGMIEWNRLGFEVEGRSS